MKFFGKEVPPRNKAETVEEYGIRPDEPIFRPKPEALNVHSLVETAKAGDAIDMVPELDGYFDGWLHYAQDRNLFSGTGEVQALAQARREAIQFAREKKYGELQAKLEELSGTLAENVEKAADANLSRIQENGEATHKEHKENLAGAVHEVEGLRPSREQSPETLHGRDEEREARAQKFAEKYEITSEREALLIAEENYADAIRRRNESFFKLEFRDDAATKGQREILESAIQKWRIALAKAGEKAEKGGVKQDALSARFIGARDAMMRMEQVRQRAIAEGLDNRSKTTIGKLDAWANKLNAKVFSAAGAAAKGFGKLSETIGGRVAGLVFDKEEDAAKYQRASRIIGSAAIMTAIFAPFGAATAGAAGAAFVWRAGRGIGGWLLGTAAGTGAGKIYDLKYSSEAQRRVTHEVSQDELLKALKDGRINLLDQKVTRQLYKEGSATQFTKSEREHAERKMKAEVATSALVAGVSAYGLSHFPPVHEALTNHPITTVPPEVHAPSLEHHAPPSHALVHHPTETQRAPGMTPPAVHIESVSVHDNVNDADKLFGRFLDNVKEQFPDPQGAPPALRTLLEQYHHVDGMHQQDVLTKFLHLQNGGSVIVHQGDSLSYENGRIVFQGHTLIDEHGSVHNLRESGQIHIEHLHTGHAAQPEQAIQGAPEQEVVQPESPTIQPAPTAEAPAQPVPEVGTPAAAPASILEHAPTVETTPAPQTEHVVVPRAPETVSLETSGPHIAPYEQVPTAQEISPTHPLPSNDNIPEVGRMLNHNGFDLSHPSVGVDSKGNLFSHIQRTGDLQKDNDLAYQTAVQYATEHHDAAVYYVVESRSALGTSSYLVEAVKFNPDHSNWNYFPDLDDPYKMPPIPTDQDLHNIAA